MKTVYNILFCLCLIITLKLAKGELLNQVESQKNLEESNERQYTNEEIRAKLLNLLLADLETEDSSNEQDEDNQALDKRMTYRYGKRMTYRYGKRSAMPYRFGKRSNEHNFPNAQQLIDFLRQQELNDEQKSKRMTYRYGRSVDKH